MRKKWTVKSCDTKLQEELSKKLDITLTLAKLLLNRNITTFDEAHNFLYGDLSHAYDPFLLKDMGKACERIFKAIDKKEKVMIYGDYDVDGITSVALLKKVFLEIGIDALTYIPNRVDEGYGLNSDAVRSAHSKGIKLIVTVDCGISAIEEVKLSSSLGMDVIITDHHEINTGVVPSAYAVINPHQKDCAYPFKYLAGVGVAYKLAQGLMKKRFYPLDRHLDLVALGTVADVVPQVSENRIFTKHGLNCMNSTDKTGLKALISYAGLDGHTITTTHIGYMLGPRINAMGRTGSPEVALKLLLTDNRLEANKIADMLNKENTSRQKIEAGILEDAMAKVERDVNFKDEHVIVLSGTDWHPGVIGIAASRIQERFYRPTILIAVNGEKGKGSGRSIVNFNLFDALKACEHELLSFGGHEGACGLSVETTKIGAFRKKINAYAKDIIKEEDLLPKLDIDDAIPLSMVTEKLISDIAMLEPYGPDNPKPIFQSTGILLRDEPRNIGKNGVKFLIRTGKGACEAISFKRDAIEVPRVGNVFDIVYTPSINVWQGIETIQLEIKDIRIKP